MRRYFVLLVSIGMLVGCAEASEEEALEMVLETQQHAIRNGTREPQVLTLNEKQKRAIGWLHPRGAASRPFCTGTVIGPRVVATASHCIQGRRASQIGFGVGLLPREADHTFTVAQAVAHPRLDAAVLILGEDTSDRDPELLPIEMNRDVIPEDLVGAEVEAAGYGETYDASREGRYFAVVQLTTIANTEVVVDGRGRQGICFGDSGGPVMTTGSDGKTVVLGVESWGDPSCLGVDHLTRLDVISEWIDEVVANYLEVEQLSPECRAAGPDGRCQNDILTWCEEGEVLSRDCAEEGLRCKPRDNAEGNDCLPPDICEVVGSRGACDGDSVQRCRFGELQITDCSANGKICRSDDGGAFCATPTGDELSAENENEVTMGDSDVSEPGGEDQGNSVENDSENAVGGVPDNEDNDPMPGGIMNGELPNPERKKGGGCQSTPGGGSAPLAVLFPGLLVIALRSKPTRCRRL